MQTIHIRKILSASFVSLVLLACGGSGDDDSGNATTTGTSTTDGTGTGTGTDGTATGTTGEPTTEPTTTTPTTTGTDTGTADTGTDDTDPGNTGTDDTGPDDTGTDDTGPVDTGTDDGGLALSFALDIYGPIIEPSCGCHEDGAGGMVLGDDAATAFAAIVGVPSNDVPGMARIEPGDPENSYLFRKVEDTHIDAGGEGNKMPPGGQLDASEIDTIKLWIEGGAQP